MSHAQKKILFSTAVPPNSDKDLDIVFEWIGYVLRVVVCSPMQYVLVVCSITELFSENPIFLPLYITNLDLLDSESPLRWCILLRSGKGRRIWYLSMCSIF
ncbi:hypothetical protein [Anaplasma phagocytophilum]|uniref:hypothetical protein n=1 Tax=Anaplasma phagocytophilum TaxID=948 RepID=UPI00201A4EC0